MRRLRSASDCRHCLHRVEAHEAGECWWDTLMDKIASWQAIERCDCPGYEPIGLQAVGA